MVAKKRLAESDGDKIFVLDTSVILHDSNAIKNFEEHNVAIPIQVLEEIDNFKKGSNTRNFEAREFIRFTDTIAQDNLINDWIPLNGSTTGKFKVIIHSDKADKSAEKILGEDKYDHKILDCALSLQKEYPDKKVILVSKDICLRLKAKALSIRAEDYETGKIKNINDLYTGKAIIEDVHEEIMDSFYTNGFIESHSLKLENIFANQYFLLNGNTSSGMGYYDSETDRVIQIEDQFAYGVTALNAEQHFALHALLNPRIKLVTIQGVAGTGKTLLALAAALAQRRNYRQIFVTRPVIPLSNNDIGYLPGDVNDKIGPYMQSLWDNMNYIKNLYPPSDKNYRRIEEMFKNDKIAIAPLAYIRGRSLLKIFFIVDEAQNLTPHEVKTIISRAGDDTKIIFAGDIHQIDTPYLDSQSNGLSFLIDRVKNQSIFAHITLEKGERSNLANLANELL